MFAIRIKSIPAMCSRASTSTSGSRSSSNVLIVSALFLIIVEINQTDCNFILPKVGTASGGLLNNDDVSISTSSSSNSGEKSASSYDETTSSYSTTAGGSTGSTSSPINSNASSATASSSGQNASTVNGFEGQIPLERLPSNTLLKYTAYKDVSILHFRIPTDTRTAFFSFKAYEESKSAFRKYSSSLISIKSNSLTFALIKKPPLPISNLNTIYAPD